MLQISKKLVVGVQRHAVQDVQEEGLAVRWSACPRRRIFLMFFSRSSGKGCDPSPNESDSWSLSPHGEVRTQILAPLHRLLRDAA